MKGIYKPTMAVGMVVVFLSLTLFSCSSEVLSDHTDVVVSDNICFDVSDSLWYLPASNEQMGITDTEYPLSGTYWSSTAAGDNTNAYIYSSGSSSVEKARMATHKIRAARRK